MTVKKGDKIKVEYTGSLDDGSVFDSSKGKDPLNFEAGSGYVIKGFDAGVIGMKKGEEKTLKIKSEDAYGDQNAMLLKKIPKAQLPPEPDPKVGMMLSLKSPNGQKIPARITEVSEKEVTIDLNHPLAGKNLTFKIKIVDIA